MMACLWATCPARAGQSVLDGITASFVNAFFVRASLLLNRLSMPRRRAFDLHT